jgi:uncharacterized protein YbjT (DUF2867 family)
MKVLVLGSTGGSGRAAVKSLLAEGHEVTAFVRRAGAWPTTPGLTEVVGDALNADDVAHAVKGHDAVVVTLGISEGALKVRLAGASGTSSQVRSIGTEHAIAAMKQHGVQRLVVQTTYGVGPTRERLTFGYRASFALLLKPQILDSEKQEQLVRSSGLNWVVVQPVTLVDTEETNVFTSTKGDRRKTSVSRRALGTVLASLIGTPTTTQQTITVSG